MATAPHAGPALPAAGLGQQEASPYKLYVAGVPKTFTAEQLQPTFEPYGEIVSCVILVEKGGTGLSRGCAFVSYATEAQAQAAVNALDNQLTLPTAPYNMRVRFAQKPRDPNAPLYAPPTSHVLTEVDRRRLFFTRGPPGIQAITINAAFSPYGEIEEINLFPERDQNTTKGCGFVQYFKQEDAAKAMAHLQGSLQLEGVVQKLVVSWADPERRMLKRKYQDGLIGPNPNYHRPMPAVPPGEEREVFFAKIPRAATEQQLGELFTRHGGPVERVKIFTSAGAPHHKCCGLATFTTHQGAANAILALDGIYLWPKFTDPMVVKWMDHSMSKTRRPDSGQMMNGGRMSRPIPGPYGMGAPQYQQMHMPHQQQMMYGHEQQQPYVQQQMYGQDQMYGQQQMGADQQWQYQQQAQPMYGQKAVGQQQQLAYSQAPQQQQPQYAQQQAGPPAMFNANGQQRQYAAGQQSDDTYGAQYGAAQGQKVPQAYAPLPVGSQGGYTSDMQAPMQQYFTPAPVQQDLAAPQQGVASYGQSQAAIGGVAASAGYGSVGASQLFPIQMQQQRANIVGR